MQVYNMAPYMKTGEIREQIKDLSAEVFKRRRPKYSLIIHAPGGEDICTVTTDLALHLDVSTPEEVNASISRDFRKFRRAVED